MQTTIAKQAPKKPATRKPAVKDQSAELLAELQAAQKSIHEHIVGIGAAEDAFSKASGGRYKPFSDMLRAALPILESATQHAAIVKDIQEELAKRDLKSVAVQLVTIVNNARKIAYGSPATRDSAAEPAQGFEVVIDALDACDTVIAFKRALAALKVVKHGGQGKTGARAGKGPQNAPKAIASADKEPSGKETPVQVAVRMLRELSGMLKPGSDADLLHEIDGVTAHLLRRFAA